MWWDRNFIEAIQTSNLTLVDAARYMDDVRVWLHGVMLGWRWVNGELIYKGTWRMEERREKMTILAKTTEIMEGVMNSICGWLKLTMEDESMFDGVLPTLDLNIWISASNDRSLRKPWCPHLYFTKEVQCQRVLGALHSTKN